MQSQHGLNVRKVGLKSLSIFRTLHIDVWSTITSLLILWLIQTRLQVVCRVFSQHVTLSLKFVPSLLLMCLSKLLQMLLPWLFSNGLLVPKQSNLTPSELVVSFCQIHPFLVHLSGRMSCWLVHGGQVGLLARFVDGVVVLTQRQILRRRYGIVSHMLSWRILVCLRTEWRCEFEVGRSSDSLASLTRNWRLCWHNWGLL